jgi:transcriptional regulator with XRE-family HTH domain
MSTGVGEFLTTRDLALKKIGPMLREARTEIGMTGVSVAKAAGMTPATLSQFEGGAYLPRVETLYRILDAITLDWIDFLERVDGRAYEGTLPRYKSAVSCRVAVCTTMARMLRRRGYTPHQYEKYHKHPNRVQLHKFKNYETTPSLKTIRVFCQNLEIDWLDFFADVQAQIYGDSQ